MVIVAALVFGAVVGGIARLLLPGRHDLSISTTILLGLLGAGTVGTAVAGATDRLLVWGGPSLAGSVIGAVGFVAVAEALARRFRTRQQRRPTSDVIATGEGSQVEFKSSARYNIHTAKKDAQIELAIARSVAGLANADGGILLIGVNDDGQVIGLEEDLKLVRGGDLDRYELWLHDLLRTCLGSPVLRHVAVSFETMGDADLCRIDIEPADDPVYLRPHTGERRTQFYVRIGNSTRELAVDDAVDRITANWPQGMPARARVALRRRFRTR